jgi:DNA-directed RNA polymerase subunit RPC12/RpoP
MKVQLKNYQSKFDLRCPRCGKDEWSIATYRSGVRTYRKCLTCGADVSEEQVKGGNDITVVIENQFATFNHGNSKEIEERIASDLNDSMGWKWPE